MVYFALAVDFWVLYTSQRPASTNQLADSHGSGCPVRRRFCIKHFAWVPPNFTRLLVNVQNGKSLVSGFKPSYPEMFLVMVCSTSILYSVQRRPCFLSGVPSPAPLQMLWRRAIAKHRFKKYLYEQMASAETCGSPPVEML